MLKKMARSFSNIIDQSRIKNPATTEKVKMKRLILILFLLSIAILSNAFAETNIEANSLVTSGKFDATSKMARIAVAKNILKKINALDDLLPNPSPSEINWINAEKKESKHNIERFANLIDSPEFQQLRLKEYLKALKVSLTQIINSTDISDEMYNWEYVSYLLIDPRTINDAIPTLKSNHKLPKHIDGNKTDIMDGISSMPYSGAYHMHGEDILRYILMPYIAKEKMDNL